MISRMKKIKSLLIFNTVFDSSSPLTMTTSPSNLDTAEQYTAQILAAAAGTGDLVTVSEILPQWLLQPGSEPAPAPSNPDL